MQPLSTRATQRTTLVGTLPVPHPIVIRKYQVPSQNTLFRVVRSLTLADCCLTLVLPFLLLLLIVKANAATTVLSESDLRSTHFVPFFPRHGNIITTIVRQNPKKAWVRNYLWGVVFSRNICVRPVPSPLAWFFLLIYFPFVLIS
jgi:hypothetical protein